MFDKFNVIEKPKNNTDNIDSLLSLFFENYLESDTYSVYPDYLYQLKWHYNLPNIDLIFDKYNILYLKQIKNNFKNLIKNNMFDIKNGLNKFLILYDKKLNYVKNLLNINVSDKKIEIFNIIFSDGIIINFLEEQFFTLNIKDRDTIIKFTNNINLINNKICNNWFLNFINNVIKNNFQYSNYPIPSHIQKLYNLNELVKYYEKVINFYQPRSNDSVHGTNNFLDIVKITELLIDLLFDNFEELLKDVNITSLYCFLKNNEKIIKSIPNYDKKLKLQIDNYLHIIIKNENYTQLCSVSEITEDNYVAKRNNYKDIDFIKLLVITNKLLILSSNILFILDNKIVQNNILEIINTKINTNLPFVLDLINIISNIKNIDNFISIYHTKLIKRLLSKETNLSNEKLCIYSFPEKIHKNKLIKTILDIEKSNNDLDNFRRYQESKADPGQDISDIAKFNNFDSITISYDTWNIDYNAGYIDYNTSHNDENKTQLFNYIDNYNSFYKLRYDNLRKLYWLPQYGEIDITYLDKNIKLLPIQFMVLEIFDQSQIAYSDIINYSFFKNYSLKLKNDIINSLIIGKLLIRKDTIISLNNENNFMTNFVEIFHNNSNFIMDEEIKRTECLNYSREDIISCWVNKFLKLNSSRYELLYNNVKDNIKLFEVSDELFNKSLTKMIDKEYIKYNKDTLEYMKLIY